MTICLRSEQHMYALFVLSLLAVAASCGSGTDGTDSRLLVKREECHGQEVVERSGIEGDFEKSVPIPTWTCGDRVTLHGLMTSQRNGQRGTVLAPDPDKENRWAVRLSGPGSEAGTKISVRGDKLRYDHLAMGLLQKFGRESGPNRCWNGDRGWFSDHTSLPGELVVSWEREGYSTPPSWAENIALCAVVDPVFLAENKDKWQREGSLRGGPYRKLVAVRDFAKGDMIVGPLHWEMVQKEALQTSTLTTEQMREMQLDSRKRPPYPILSCGTHSCDPNAVMMPPAFDTSQSGVVAVPLSVPRDDQHWTLTARRAIRKGEEITSNQVIGGTLEGVSANCGKFGVSRMAVMMKDLDKWAKAPRKLRQQAIEHTLAARSQGQALKWECCCELCENDRRAASQTCNK